MSLAKSCFPLLVLLVALGFAAREVPELMRLLDDASNDGEQAACCDALVPKNSSRSVSPEATIRVALGFSVLGAEPEWTSPLTLPFMSYAEAGQGLLKLISLQLK